MLFKLGHRLYIISRDYYSFYKKVVEMKKLSFLGISILAVGCFFLVLMGSAFVEYLGHVEYFEKTCSKPGTSCPFTDPWYLLPYGIPGLVLVILGTYILVVSRTRN